MSNEHRMIRTRQGTVLQSGIPKRVLPNQPLRARGLILKAVVTATYVVDDPNHFQADGRTPDGPVAVYCDVLSYTNIVGMRWRYIPRCLVMQPPGRGMHRGRIFKPRPTTLDITGNPVDANKASNPANWDGDHVAIQFFNDNLNEPFISGSIPHPKADEGNEQKDAGHRMRVTEVDGDPDFWKHHGAFYGIDDAGDFIVDTTDAYAGSDLEDDGKEKAAAEDGSTGNYRIRIPKSSKLLIEIDEGSSLELDLKDSSAKLILGDGLKSAIIAEAWETFWDGPWKTYESTHTHGSGVGPTGPPIQAASFPAYGTANATSTKLTFPDA